MLSTGSLDRKVSLERSTPTQDNTGEPIPAWERIGKTRWARRAPVAGDERYTSTQFIAREQVQWTARWAEDIADLAPGDRLVYPVTDTPTDSEIYDIIAVHEMGYRVAIIIVTARRAET